MRTKKQTAKPNPNVFRGDLVRITKTEVNYAAGKVGTLQEFKEGGYVVTLKDVSVPISGVNPRTEKQDATVWAEEVEPVEDVHRPEVNKANKAASK